MTETKQLYCFIRKEWVAHTPEELVRQTFITYMVQQLEFPPELLAVEQELRKLPHLANTTSIPERRADLICFAKEIHPKFPLYPLLLVECKAVTLNPKALEQAIGYNHHLGAYFIAVVNHEELQVGWYDLTKKKYRFVNHLPSYPELLKAIKGQSG